MARSYIYRTAVIYTCIIVVVANVTLDFQPEKIRLNEDINITCTVHGIDNINGKLTRQWSKGTDTICYNGRPTDLVKYKEILTTGNKFKLQIKNISDSDVNSKYQCRYDFYTEAKSLPLSNNDEYPPSDELRAIVHYNKSNGRLTVDLLFKKVFPMPICAALIEGKRSPFDTTSTKSFGDYNEVVLLYKSTEKLHCNAKVLVKCILIKEYNIPTEDLRKCSLKENPSEELTPVLTVILLSTLILILTISISIFVIFWKRKKRKPGLSQQNREIELRELDNTLLQNENGDLLKDSKLDSSPEAGPSNINKTDEKKRKKEEKEASQDFMSDLPEDEEDYLDFKLTEEEQFLKEYKPSVDIFVER